MNDLPNLKIAPSALGKRIFAGYSDEVKGKPGLMRWRKQQDVTDQAVHAVLVHLLDDKPGMEWEFASESDKIVVTVKRIAKSRPRSKRAKAA